MPSDLLVIFYENDIAFQPLTALRCDELLEKGIAWGAATTDPDSKADSILIFFPFAFPPNEVFRFTPIFLFILRDRAPFIYQAFIRPEGHIT